MGPCGCWWAVCKPVRTSTSRYAVCIRSLGLCIWVWCWAIWLWRWWRLWLLCTTRHCSRCSPRCSYDRSWSRWPCGPCDKSTRRDHSRRSLWLWLPWRCCSSNPLWCTTHGRYGVAHGRYGFAYGRPSRCTWCSSFKPTNDACGAWCCCYWTQSHEWRDGLLLHPIQCSCIFKHVCISTADVWRRWHGIWWRSWLSARRLGDWLATPFQFQKAPTMRSSSSKSTLR
mmetsp:Transcript_3854/g.6485  ORF Transcript_3854/g.6485 Transcript_3854/m.6485 type:complete len:226 (+) Transcript_3854:964-1641(+)